MKSIEMFLLERAFDLDDLAKVYEPGYVYEAIHQQAVTIRRVVQWHQNWPILVESEPKIEATDFPDIVNRLQYRMTMEINFMTHQAYTNRFGKEPPTAPILAIMANAWSEHPDFNPEWRI